MAPNNGTLGQVLLQSIGELRDDIREVRDTADDIRTELGGKDGIRERLTALECRVEELTDRENTPVSIPVPVKYTPTTVDHLKTASIPTAFLALVQIIPEIMKLFK